jgi:hypothetical protein
VVVAAVDVAVIEYSDRLMDIALHVLNH